MFNQPSSDPYIEGFYEGLKPPPILTVSEWANQNRILSSVSSPNPGPWKTSRTPYLREPMDCLSSHSPVEFVDLMFGSQLGKSEGILNWVGYKIDHSPGPMMVVQPTVDMAKRFSKQRVTTLSETPAIKEKLRPARERDSGNTILQKDFPGGTLILTGANSAVGLSSAPVGALALDETDRYPDTTEEGDPVELAIARTKNFVNCKIFRTSTPTTVERSRIYKSWVEGDQSYYHVPCPHCEELQILKWGGKDTKHGVKWNEGKPETAHYVCEKNGCIIQEHHKIWMVAEENGARWIAERPELSHYHRSFQLSTIYSPWYSWEKAVRAFLKAKKHPEKLKAWVNTYLGEPWKEKEGEAPDWRILYMRREPFKIGQVPSGGLMLVAGCDVQADRIEAQVVAFGRNEERWIVDHRIFPGETNHPEAGAFLSLRSFVQEQYPHENGHTMPMRMVGIDASYNSQVVYSFVRDFPPDRVIAIRGFDNLKMMVGTPIATDINFEGKKIRRGLRYYPLGVSIIKEETYGLLKIKAPTDEELKIGGYPSGFIHYPELDQEFFEQLCGEHKTYKDVKGYRVYFWEKTRERNEALDCHVIARGMASLCGVDRMDEDQWAELASQYEPIRTVDEEDDGDIPRRKSDYWR